MKSFLLLPLLAVFVLGSTLVRSSAQDTDNAALLYWQAIIAANPLTIDQRKMLVRKPSEPFDESTAENIVRQWQYSLDTVKKASDKPMCNWALDLNEGPALRLTQYNRCQEFAQVLRLRARLRLQRGDIDGAADDIVTMLRFNRHVGEPALVVPWLVQITIQGIAMQVIADNLPRFSDAALSRLAQTLRTLPATHTMPELMRTEKRGLADWMLRVVRQSQAKHENAQEALWYQQILRGFTLTDSDGPNTRPNLLHDASMEEAARAVETLPQDFDELIRLVETPDPQSRPALHEFMERARAGKTASRLTALLLTPFETVQQRGSATEAMRAMLLAGHRRTAAARRTRGAGAVARPVQ